MWFKFGYLKIQKTDLEGVNLCLTPSLWRSKHRGLPLRMVWDTSGLVIVIPSKNYYLRIDYSSIHSVQRSCTPSFGHLNTSHHYIYLTVKPDPSFRSRVTDHSPLTAPRKEVVATLYSKLHVYPVGHVSEQFQGHSLQVHGTPVNACATSRSTFEVTGTFHTLDGWSNATIDSNT